MNLQGPRSSAPDPGELARLAAERAAADRRYNEALTALDRAIVAATAASAGGRDELLAAATALIVFLQQITAFVDTKDREAGARNAADLATLKPWLDAVAELRTQVSVLQRTVASVARATSAAAPAAQQGGPAALHPATDVLYVAFEDSFRGTDEAIAGRLRAYLPLFAGAADVVDLGCGRGEFLAALKAAGISGRGVDLNREMAAVARDRGLDVTAGDALEFLASLPDASIGGLMAAQVVEHLEPAYLLQLIETAAAKLRPGAPIVIETINAACWLAFFSSYIRDLTHVRPIHPDTLQYLLRASMFERVTIEYSAPVPDNVRMQPVHLPADVLSADDVHARALAGFAHSFNANMAVLNSLMFTHLDYAAVAYRV